jgi:alpha/beta superfamily hydrolase
MAVPHHIPAERDRMVRACHNGAVGADGSDSGVVADFNTAQEARGVAVLLHPHPHFGGSRFHPFIEGLFRRLPGVGVHAVRFDFTSGDVSVAREEADVVIDEAIAHWPNLPVVLAGYSFGAGVAADLDDARTAGWYLLAPPSGQLSSSTIGHDPRPKAVVIPEFDQYSPPATVALLVDRWEQTRFTTVPNTDHFLGAVQPIVDDALEWIGEIAGH